MNERGNLKKFLLYGKSFLPFLLSHHPDCNNFGGHTLNFGKYKFCIGCFIGYPTAIITFLALRFLPLNRFIPPQYFFIFGLLFLSTFILSVLKLTKNKKIKILQKFFIGLGAASLVYWIMELPNPRSTNLIIALITIWVIIMILNIHHVYGFLNTCHKCETPFNWGYCSGFETIRTNMEKYNLSNFLISLEDFSHSLLEKRKEKTIDN